MNNIVCKNKIAFNIKWKKLLEPNARRTFRLIKKNLGWSKFLCRQDLKVSLYVRLLEFILLLLVANYRTKILDFFSWIKGMQNNLSISIEMFLSKTKILR